MALKTEGHIRAVIELLNEQADYAVLRNYEGLPDNNKSRDIDIIITKESLRKIRPVLLQLIEDNGWKIVTYLNSDRLYTYVLSVWDDTKTELVQWDFFVNTSVWGVLLMDAPEFLQNKQWNGFLYHVGVAEQFLDKYLYNRAVGAAYPEKYAETKALAKDLPFVKEKLQRTFDVRTVEDGDAAKGRSLFWRCLKKQIVSRPLTLLGDISRFLQTFVGNYIHSQTGFSIGFTGPDGAGKTTVIDMMISEMGDVFRSAHAYYHFRPNLFGNISDVAHQAGLKKEVDKNYDQPHRGGKTNVASSLLRLAYYTTDYIIGYFLKVKTKTRITRMVVFDRYYTDIICDSRRSRIYLSPQFLYGFSRLFIPSLDYNILLTASTDTILSRKGELDREGVEAINDRINFLKDKRGYLVVMNESEPQEAVHEILQYVFKRQHQKNKKRNGFS